MVFMIENDQIYKERFLFIVESFAGFDLLLLLVVGSFEEDLFSVENLWAKQNFFSVNNGRHHSFLLQFCLRFVVEICFASIYYLPLFYSFLMDVSFSYFLFVYFNIYKFVCRLGGKRKFVFF